MNSYATYQDGELLIFLRNSDQAAFTEIYDRYFEAVFTYLLSYVKDPMLTEDLAHDVFIKLWEIRERLQIQASFEAYLFRICHNMALNIIKRSRSETRLATSAIQHLQTISSPGIQPSSALQRYDSLLDEAVNSLSPQRRRVFVLCRQEGKSYEQAAAELGVSRNTVKEHMAEALKSLRSFLGDKGEIAFALVIIQHLF